MLGIRRIFAVIFLAIGAAAAITPSPAMATYVNVKEIHEAIDKWIDKLEAAKGHPGANKYYLTMKQKQLHMVKLSLKHKNYHELKKLYTFYCNFQTPTQINVDGQRKKKKKKKYY